MNSLKLSLKVVVTLLVFGVMVATVANAASVFKVSKGDDVVYIGGTFHLLTQQDYPLPEAYNKAYKASDELFFETDIAELSNPATMQKMMAIMVYQDGNTLKTGLDEKTFARVEEYLTSKKLSVNQFLPLNPTGFMLTVTILEYQMRGFTAEGVDKFYYDKALADDKKVSWFETLDEQLAIMDSFDNGDPNGLINYSLDQMGEIDGLITDLHQSWRSGDMETLNKLGNENMGDYPEIYDAMLTNRNNKWMNDIVKMFGDDNTEFVLVGALHLPGKVGVLTQLEKLGYKVEQVK